MCGSQLSLNMEKTNYIIFRPPDFDLNIRINNIKLPRVQSTKILGIVIDEKINWKPHILVVKGKLSKTLSILYKASKLISYEGMLTMYYSHFIPYLCYCNEIWGNAYASNVKCIYILQKKQLDYFVVKVDSPILITYFWKNQF